MATSRVHHVRYDDFINMASDGVGDVADFMKCVDTLVLQMGTLQHHSLIIDLRGAIVAPLPESVTSQMMTYMQDQGLGVTNRVVFLTSPDDTIRTERMQTAMDIGLLLGMRVHHFHDHEKALDWLNGPEI